MFVGGGGGFLIPYEDELVWLPHLTCLSEGVVDLLIPSEDELVWLPHTMHLSEGVVDCWSLLKISWCDYNIQHICHRGCWIFDPLWTKKISWWYFPIPHELTLVIMMIIIMMTKPWWWWWWWWWSCTLLTTIYTAIGLDKHVHWNVVADVCLTAVSLLRCRNSYGKGFSAWNHTIWQYHYFGAWIDTAKRSFGTRPETRGSYHWSITHNVSLPTVSLRKSLVVWLQNKFGCPSWPHNQPYT